MRDIDTIIIHCADTYAHMDVGAEEIRRWHVEERGWSDIGYHAVIRRDGSVEKGRPIDRPGAHAKGHNARSIGICLVGGKSGSGEPEFNFSIDQMRSLNGLVSLYREQYPSIEQVIGHNDVSAKSCPCFDVISYFGGEDA